MLVHNCHELRPGLLTEIAESGATLVGLTATPFPAKMADHYEGMVNVVTTDRLIADRFLCPFDVIAPVATVEMDGVKSVGGEFDLAETSKRVMRIVGDVVPTWEGVVRDRFGGKPPPTIVFGASVADADELRATFCSAGYDARLVSSHESDDANAATIAAFRNGEFGVLVNCAMLSRGFDAPATAILIDVYPMRKMLTPIQRYGRVMRTAPGKRLAVLIDHAENWLSMRSRILAFYHNGPSWPPPEAANKAARDKRPQRSLICRNCRQVLSPEDVRCPACGTERPKRTWGGAGAKLQRVNGHMQVVDSVSGEVTLYEGDLWSEVCTESLRLCSGDQKRAENRALASYKAITGAWPGRNFAPKELGAPDPAVADLMRRNFQAWLIARKAREARA